MPTRLPLNNSSSNILSFFDISALLDDVTYTLQFRWNVRASAWFMDIYDIQGETTIIGGLRVVVNFPLAAYFTGRQPPGALVFVDTSGKGIDPGFGDLGGRVSLLYFAATELGLVAAG